MADFDSNTRIICHACRDSFFPKTAIAAAQQICENCEFFLKSLRSFIRGKTNPRGTVNMLISVIMNPNYDRSRARRERAPINVRSLKYEDYLKTAHWEAVRFKAMKRADWKCALCFSKDGIQVHHKHYNTLGKELPHFQ